MTIETRPYEFTRQDLFRLTLRAYLVRQGWGYLAAAIVIIGLTIANGRSLMTILLLAGFAALILIGVPVFFIRRYANDPARQLFLGKRRCEFQADGLRFIGEKGNATLAWREVVHVSRTASYYLFFVDKMQFYYVPFAAFKTTSDHEHIEQYLQQRKFI